MIPRKILITSALPYANGPLHFGHIAGAYLPADCYARFKRLTGDEVLYICGSDEHGVAITLSAELAQRTPQEHVDHYHEVIQHFFRKLHLSFDHYSRTTWEGHAETTIQFFKDLLANGYIEERVTDQLFAEKERRFLADRYVVGTCPRCGFEEARGDECPKCGASYEAVDLKLPRSKLTGSSLIKKPTKHWFLRFDLFKEKLSSWLATKEWKPNVVAFARNYIDDLRPRAITRDGEWGIPVPLEEAKGKVFYVWFDAPIGYISATKEWAQKKGSPDLWKEYWLDPETKLVQFIGKDNIPFHAVFFPAMVMGQNVPYKLVDELPANEFYLLEGKQFSKSDGWYIDLERFFAHFTTDQIRYMIAATCPETQDSAFTWKEFQLRCNSELLAKFGNFANRTLVFIQNHGKGHVPKRGALFPKDIEFLEQIKKCAASAQEAYENFSIRKASQILMELSQIGNVYFDARKPWSLAKDPVSHGEMHTVLSCCLECLKVLALIAFPLIPETAEKLWALLGFTTPLAQEQWDSVLTYALKEDTMLPTPQPLCAKVEDSVVEAETAALKPKMAVQENGEISIDDVKKLDLRVAEIVSVERVPKSKKLLKIQVNLGTETRTIVAGIGEKREDLGALVGKKVLLVANLKPATLMGIQSQGMLLAADTLSGIPELAAFLESTPGAQVK